MLKPDTCDGMGPCSPGSGTHTASTSTCASGQLTCASSVCVAAVQPAPAQAGTNRCATPGTSGCEVVPPMA